ncbi:c-type cytochrome [Prosthecomicrobium hirschii]|uniref:c-type cytochrome n=1 Tax=Prosthecodimorpha hirschii TaxID=665126 RepID=UPI00221EB34F|nr:cytochrome c [Prosthecomicrobium hirschii]MCW1843056.1 cytochrome c [Prosthecomicrobium hirschii]
MKQSMGCRLAAAAGVAALALTLVSTGTRGETLVEARQRLMVAVVKATKVMREMAQGKAKLDPDLVKDSVRTVSEATAVLPNLFPEGSQAETSAALPALWQNKEDFDARLDEMNRSAILLVFAARQGDGAFRYAFDQYQQVCQGCHAKYRKPE